ncbi:U2 snRNP-associated SURP motif-containing protein-like isoform X1 [Pomacea canaliculata]|uniref:U2 snRNP-associated SURP motif-containing protein-like isoform X1 n=1 Tax=Pomacea canaliculata TaxID=400727 RepID=UPI000D73644F|nr:U2 snRNP-associated SURP motif-containing protein-like isoform X1 [Pomacea canaliculata]
MADRQGKSGSKNKESGIKGFELNPGKKIMSKKEQEELKKKQDEEAAAMVYEEFVASFEDSQKLAKAWVKGGVVNPGEKSKEEAREEKSRLYRPTSKVSEVSSSHSTKEAKKEERVRERESRFEPRSSSSSSSSSKKKKDEKKKSNLELFKEELKLIQEERQERHKLKRNIRDEGEVEPPPPVEPRPSRLGLDFLDMSVPFSRGSAPVDPGDENTTNIYVGNINPKMTEQQLCEVFGKYGPLASIKIMWPRTDEERSRGRNCGFVAFMNRKDGERAMNMLRGKEVQGFEMKLGWGKAVPIPAHPIYIPPALAELTQPPPPSGLPFNAQPQKKRKADRDRNSYGGIPLPGQLSGVDSISRGTDEPEEAEKTLTNAVVKVVIPTERTQLCLIHRMIEFVVREGPMFEAMIMNRELNNPQYRFLFENQSPNHIYYRWKLFSILQGDSPYKWRTEEFRMFKGGSLWRPPPINPYTQGMPDELINKEVEDTHSLPPSLSKKGSLTDSQRDRLEDMLRELTPERLKVGEVMVWCLDHAEAAEEIVECISEALSILQTPLPKKIARLYLVSDILYNSSAKVPNASFFRKCFQIKLSDIFKDIHETYEKIDGRLKAEQFKQKVMACFRAWEDWAIYPNDFLINLQNIFLGLVFSKIRSQLHPFPKIEERSPEYKATPKSEDLDGAPIEDLDGTPLALDPAITFGKSVSEDIDGDALSEDLDGLPLAQSNEDLDGRPIGELPKPAAVPAFTRSKWESVDETELEAQAMTTSKWDLLEQESDTEKEVAAKDIDEDIDGAPLVEEPASLPSESSDEDSEDGSNSQRQQMSEERRAKLREIEMKVVKYQDDLEMGRRSRKSHMSISEQVAYYRKKLLSKEESLDGIDSPNSREGRKRHRSRSPATPVQSRSVSPKRSKKNKSPKRSKKSRSRSRSPRGKSPHSPSRYRHKHKSRKHRD